MSKIFDTYYSALIEDRISQKVGGGGDNNEDDNDEQGNNVDVGWDTFISYTCDLAWRKECVLVVIVMVVVTKNGENLLVTY